MTLVALCLANNLSQEAAEKALANLQEKGLVTGYIPGDTSAEILLTNEASVYFAKK